MAYGKIKADTLVWDNSGSDVETTIQSLTTPAPEGTVVKSTGESGTTKFLRVDGDGTCSWQVPPDTNTQLTLIDEDDMASNDATKPPSQQSVKAYVDTKAPTANPTFTGTLTCADLTVNGTTTTVNSATLTVDDKNIELGSVSSPSDTTADGGGITLKGATDKEIKWVNSTDNWTFNQNIEVTSGAVTIAGGEGSAALLYMNADEGDDNADKWKFRAHTNGELQISNYSTGSYVDALTIDGSGNIVGGAAVSDSKGDVRNIPQNTQASSYTLVASDAGKHILASGTIVLPPSVFSAGDAVTIVNNTSGNIAIQVSGGSVYNADDASTGNWTLKQRGMITVMWISATVAHMSGAGL